GGVVYIHGRVALGAEACGRVGLTDLAHRHTKIGPATLNVDLRGVVEWPHDCRIQAAGLVPDGLDRRAHRWLPPYWDKGTDDGPARRANRPSRRAKGSRRPRYTAPQAISTTEAEPATPALARFGKSPYA